MPKRTDIKLILIIGSGPIVIGQACEFDYSGTQGLKALKEEGFRVILINSNPATIMTDPDFADRTYIEPITVDMLEKIIERERPDALLPTLGWQAALNISIDLAERGILDRYGVEMIGAKLEAIKKAEDRGLFKQAMKKIGLDLPQSGIGHNHQEALKIHRELGFPLIIRPSRTLGGSGGNIVYGSDDFEEVIQWGLSISPVREVLVEESVLGWKEFELEVMRDQKDNVVIVCSIENFDPMGIHTGDSITVAPAQTLTDKEYQLMRDAALKIIREIGVDTGESNIQFAVHPETGRLVVVEMNPRVSRSSALASKATGFPIAKIAAKLAIGYNLDEIPNGITRETPACFEPTIDYVVVRIPRFTLEKFPKTKDILTTQMKSVGEAMAIGRTFKEALQKAMRSLKTGSYGFEEKMDFAGNGRVENLKLVRQRLESPNASVCGTSAMPSEWECPFRRFTASPGSIRGSWSMFAGSLMRRKRSRKGAGKGMPCRLSFSTRSSRWAFPIIVWPFSGIDQKRRYALSAFVLGSARCSAPWTPAGRSLLPIPPTCIPRTNGRTSRILVGGKKSSFWEVGQTESARGSNSITVVSMPPLP